MMTFNLAFPKTTVFYLDERRFLLKISIHTRSILGNLVLEYFLYFRKSTIYHAPKDSQGRSATPFVLNLKISVNSMIYVLNNKIKRILSILLEYLNNKLNLRNHQSLTYFKRFSYINTFFCVFGQFCESLWRTKFLIMKMRKFSTQNQTHFFFNLFSRRNNNI